MSDPTSSTVPADDDASPEPAAGDVPPSPPPSAAPEPKTSKKKGRWRHRLWVAVRAIVILFLAFRIAIAVALPTVLHRVAAYYDLDCVYDRSQLSFTGGDVALWHVAVRPPGAVERVLYADYVHGHIDPLQLLRGRLIVWRAEVDGAELNVDRLPDGSVPLVDRFLARRANAATAAAAAPTTRPAGPIELDAPLRVDAIRLSHLVAHVKDHGVSPPLETRLVLDLRASDLGQHGRPTPFEISLSADGLLDELRVTGERRGDAANLDADVAVVVRGLRLKPAAGYLQPLGIKPIADDLTVRMSGHITAVATTRPSTLPSLVGSLALRDVTVAADGQEAVGLDRLAIDLSSLDSQSAQFGKLLIDGVRLNGLRSEGGNLRLAGIELVPAMPSVATPPAAPATRATASSPPPPPPSAPAAFHASLHGFDVRNVRLHFDDRAVDPPTALTAAIDQLNSKDFAYDPDRPAAPMDVGGTFRLPGLAETITITGSVAPFADRKAVDLTLDLTGFRPDLLKPYLDAAGIESRYEAGTVHCRLQGGAQLDAKGRLTADAQLSDLTLADGGASLLRLGLVRFAGVSLDPATGLVRADAVDIAGPALTARRAKDGSISALGFHLKPPEATTRPNVTVAAATPPATTGPTSAPAAALPRFELGRFSWKDVRLELRDETVDPPTTLSLGDAGVEMRDVTFDLDAVHPAREGTIRAWLAAPGVARRLTVDGTVTPQPSAATVNLKIAGDGLSGAKLAPYLKPLGVEPTLRDGSLAVTVKGSVARRGDGLTSTLAVEQLRYADGPTELASLAGLSLKDLAVVGNDQRIGEVIVDRPRLRAARDADGWISIAGVRLDPNRKAPPPPATQPTTATIAAATVREAVIDWTDRVVSPAVQTTATVSLDVRDAMLGKPGARPGTFKLLASTNDSVNKLAAEGTFLASPDTQSLKAVVTGEGIRQGALAGYLPPGLALETRDGRLKTGVDASIEKNPKGGQAIRLAVGGFDWRDGAQPLVKFDAVRLNAPRVDPNGKVIAIDELSVSGVEADARLDAGGITRAAGIALGVPSAPAGVKAPATVPAAQPSAPTTTVSATQLAARAREVLPLVTIRQLDLGVRRASVVDATRPSSAPLTISDLRLTNPEPIAWLGPDAANLPATKFNLDGRIDPLVDKLTVRAAVTPFAVQPAVDIDWALTGIKGSGVTKLVPELSALLDGTPLPDGSFKGHVEARVTLDRRVANDFDLSKGFALDLTMKGTEFRATPDGPVLLGLDELQTEGAHFRSDGGIQIKSLELTKPVGSVVREADGLHVLGMVVKLPGTPAPSSQPSPQAASSQPASQAAATSQPVEVVVVAKPSPPTTKPAAEMRIDRLLISGLDLGIEDRAVNPPMILPLTGLDVDVRGLSNWLPYEDKAVRFTVLVSSGKAPLPKRGKGGDDATATEERELFSEVSASGKLALYPKPNGWLKASVNGVEAVGFAGEARTASVTLGGGTFDASADLRFPGDGSAEARARLVATDLLIAEPDDGPIRTALKLNAPLSLAIKAIEGADGSITIPVKFTLKDGQLDGIGASAIGAVASVFAVAVVSAPLKVGAGALAVVGIKLGGKVDLTPVTLAFPAGDAGLEPDAQRALATLIARLRKNRNLEVILHHQPGGGDVTAVGQRVNLRPEEAAPFAEELRARKLELLRLRADVAGEAKARLVASSPTDADAAVERLKGIDRELSQTEDALDRVYDLLRPGAERQADRRARQATIALGASRLLAVRAALLASGVPDAERRVKLTNAKFNPTDDADGGGAVTIEVTTAKKKG